MLSGVLYLELLVGIEPTLERSKTAKKLNKLFFVLHFVLHLIFLR